MNRTEAARLVDEILATSLAVWQDGRCPRCEALLIPPRDTWRPGKVGHHDVMHAGWCSYLESEFRAGEELRRLTLRFGFAYDDVMIEVQPGVGLLTRRRETKGAV